MTTGSESGVKQSDILIYFLASEKDADVCQAINRHLTPIVRNSAIPIRVLDDFDVPAGSDLEGHRRLLMEADIVLSLISADFINDDDVYNRNQAVIERYNRGETLMISILVRNCLWKASPLAHFPVLPKNLQPLNNKQFWNSEDDAVTAVVTDLYESINGILAEMATIAPAAPADAPSGDVVVTLTDTGEPVLAGGGTDTLEPSDRVGGTAPEERPAEASPVAVEDTGVVIELPDTEEVNAPAAQSTFTFATPAVSAPVQTDWRKSYYQGVLGKRAAAILLDFVVLFFVVPFTLAFMYFVVADVLGLGAENDVAVIDWIFYLCIAVFYLVAPALEASKWRATPGKRILKLEITTEQGERISYGRAFVRNVLRSLTLYSYILVVPLVIQYFRFKKAKQLFHDELSSTVIGERLTA